MPIVVSTMTNGPTPPDSAKRTAPKHGGREDRAHRQRLRDAVDRAQPAAVMTERSIDRHRGAPEVVGGAQPLVMAGDCTGSLRPVIRRS